MKIKSFSLSWKMTLLVLVTIDRCHGGVEWGGMICAQDGEEHVPEGLVPEIGRFPWLGVIQYSFYLGGSTKFAVTPGVLIHPGYVLASSEDIAKIPNEEIHNNTQYIIWVKNNEKRVVEVYDYVLHPEYPEQTLASIALVRLRSYAMGLRGDPVVPPICMPVKGIGVFDDLYIVQMTDENGEMAKEVQQIYYVPDKDCKQFYVDKGLNYEKMAPVNPLCVKSRTKSSMCIVDGGSVLVARIDYAYWTMIGFGVRGPGCAAPARFAAVHRYMGWIDDIINMREVLSDVQPDETAFYLRYLSPNNFQMEAVPNAWLPDSYGFCDQRTRGSILYREEQDITINKMFAHGYFLLSVTQMAMFNCVEVKFDTERRSETELWLEHSCIPQTLAHGFMMGPPDRRKSDCFILFKTAAFIEVRFIVAFKGTLVITLYGSEYPLKPVPNPWRGSEPTENWWPTERYLHWGSFEPLSRWKNYQ